MSEEFKAGNSQGFDDGNGNFGLHCELGDLSPTGVDVGEPVDMPPFLLAKLYSRCGCVAVPADKAPDSCPTHSALQEGVIQPSTGVQPSPVQQARIDAVKDLLKENN